jgi:predicted nucleotidyltransferase
MAFGLSEETLKKINQVFEKNPAITQVKIYGSRALETYRNNSDIDLALWGNLTYSQLAEIHLDLDELSTPYLFDIQIYNDISHPSLREHIDQFGKIIFQR